ncbi:MAG: hypothetical protein J6K20_01410 [Thermoguttaceae bacterium]|nr:hypothetical protein [Thermoguttaceae bacterium]
MMFGWNWRRKDRLTIKKNARREVEGTEIKYVEIPNPDGSTTTIRIERKFKDDEEDGGNLGGAPVTARPNRPLSSGGNYIDSERSE